MRLLITGASGLLGLNLALEISKNHIVYGIINQHQLKTEAFNVIQANLLAPKVLEKLIDQTQPDWVINCAALAIIDDCENNPSLAIQLNKELPDRLSLLLKKEKINFLHISTDAVFDGILGDYTEEDIPNPLSIYARTKLSGERAVMDNYPEAIIARTNIFGWSLSGKRSISEFFFYNLQAGKTVNGFSDVYFCPLLVNDLASILLEMCSSGLQGLYHVVSCESMSKYHFGVKLANQFGFPENLVRPSAVLHSGLHAARSPRLILDSSKLASALGSPLPKISTGIEHFFTLYQRNYPQRLKQLAEI